MHTIHTRNVNGALAQGLTLLAGPDSLEEETRNGPVRSAPSAVVTVTERPMERVLFSPLRNANPIFHLMESLWMLAGRNDLPWLAQFNKQMATYSDDGGKTQPAAYGHRWREYFGYDQLELVITELTERPNSRRAVLAMWDPSMFQTGQDAGGDLAKAICGSKDVPCNTHCYFRVQDGKLDMAVSCRSNDALWGAHGANAVHFSVLQEYVAAKLGVAMGTMTQFSFNYHYYPGVLKWDAFQLAQDALEFDLYELQATGITPLFRTYNVELFDRELPVFMDYAAPSNKPEPFEGRRKTKRPSLLHPTFTGLALPMLEAWDWHKVAAYDRAFAAVFDIMKGDWHQACYDWMLRRRDWRDTQGEQV